jgi:hypothetical protein
MAYGFGQLSGFFDPFDDLMWKVGAQSSKEIIALTKIGIQLEKANRVFLNNKEFEIGKTGKLEFDDVYITSIQLANRNNTDKTTPIFAILDYVYLDKEEG